MTETTDDPLDGVTIGFAGCGKMGSAIARSLVDSGAAVGEQLWLLDKVADRAEALAEALGAHAAQTSSQLTEKAGLIVLAVKPQDVAPLLGSTQWPGTAKILVSIAAGVKTERIEELVPSGVNVVRAMPNTPALVGAGITAVQRHPITNIHDKVTALLESCGDVVVIDSEDDFDAVTALSGSGPAYVFVAIEALADAGVLAGLDRQIALDLARHMVRGAAHLAVETDAHPAQLKDDVASPAGTTIEALAELERRGFRAALIEAVTAAAGRSAELGED